MKTLNKPQKVQERLMKYDKNIIYVNGYENKQSIITIKCKRCGTIKKVRWSTFIMKYSSKTNYEFCDNCRVDKLKKMRNKITNDTLLDREKQFIERLNKKYPMFEYVSGYEHSEKPVILRCKKCGYEFERTAQIVRHNKNLTCNNCVEIKRNNKKYIQQLIIQYENNKKKKLKEESKALREFKKYLKSNTLYIKHCKYCGKEIINKQNNKIICSQCYKKYNKKHSTKSLKALYKRDNGICYLCGCKCNYEDYIIKNGTIICGDYYPSIEHVIPISKGGTDNWDNIRLAHRKCNNKKGNKLIF